jgi:valyl-tRNA synthetase
VILWQIIRVLFPLAVGARQTVSAVNRVNCRHSILPFWPGITTRRWSQEEIEKGSAKTLTYTAPDGTKRQIGAYDATQYLRKLERQMRQLRREEAVNKAGGNEGEVKTVRKKIRELSGKINKFCESTGLRRQYERERVSK